MKLKANSFMDSVQKTPYHILKLLLPLSVSYHCVDLELISWSIKFLALYLVQFHSDNELSYFVCTIIPYSAAAVIVHIHSVC